jgi:hypothetical protein
MSISILVARKSAPADFVDQLSDERLTLADHSPPSVRGAEPGSSSSAIRGAACRRGFLSYIRSTLIVNIEI